MFEYSFRFAHMEPSQASQARVASQRSEWRVRRRSAATSPAAVTAPVAAEASHKPEPASPALVRLAPWLQQLRAELLGLSHEAAKLLEGFDVLADSGADSGSDGESSAAAAQPAGAAVDAMRRLGSRLGSLLQLMRDELLPAIPSDPDALFLAAAGHFLSRDYDGALSHAQRGLMAAQRGGPHEAARRRRLLDAEHVQTLSVFHSRAGHRIDGPRIERLRPRGTTHCPSQPQLPGSARHFLDTS